MENPTPHNRVLLLSCGTGQGHNACAHAIAERCALRGDTAVVVDALTYVSQGFARFLAGGHSLMYRRGPALFRFGWRYAERHRALFARRSPLVRKLASGADRLAAAIRDGGYDTVISTHALTAVLLSETLRRHPLPVRTAFVATDYTAYPCMEPCALDAYFLPDESLFDAYAAYGIPRERMRVARIPVRRDCFTAPDKPTAKAALGLDPAGRHLLVMSGSMGCGPMARLVHRLSAALPPDTTMTVTVICGTNDRLRRRLARRVAGNHRIRILGYCDNVPLYMAASDLYLTKPGGISTGEAATCGLPMVFVNAVAGCEQYNLDYFTALGGAVTADTSAALAALCLSLLGDPSTLAAMETALREGAFTDGAAVICETLNPQPTYEKGVPVS